MISICVPAYEMKGKGVEHLGQLLDSLCHQTYHRFEVVVSDDSRDDAIKDFLEQADYPLDIHYLKHESEQKSASANVNNAIRHAKYPIVKPVFQDDWIIDDEMLARIMKGKAKWGVLGWKQSDSGDMRVPQWTNKLLIGINKLGCPTGIYFEKREDLYFDENLINLMDVDLYYRLKEAYGMPDLIGEPCYVSRVWEGSVSQTQVSRELHYKELRYLEDKYNRKDLVSAYEKRLKLLEIRKKLVAIKRFIFGTRGLYC